MAQFWGIKGDRIMADVFVAQVLQGFPHQILFSSHVERLRCREHGSTGDLMPLLWLEQAGLNSAIQKDFGDNRARSKLV
jgi:hypothetical protein